MHLAEINEVIKASPAIQIQSKITHLQRRAWNVLLANAYNELPNKDIHRVSVAELAKSLGFNSHNEDYLKETLEALVDCTVKWNVLGKDKKERWGVAALLASAEIENGICTYGFAPHLRLKLYNPRIYTKLNLRLQNRFTSRYALVLWEVCFDYFDIARNQGETPFIPIERFRELMGLEKDEYPVFKVLNRDVIKPAIKEINELTNFFVEVEQKRVGRRIGELKFKISRLQELPSVEPVQETFLFDIEDLPPTAIKLVQAGVSRKEALRIANQEWDAVNAAALPEDREDFAVYVEEKIGFAQHATSVKNPRWVHPQSHPGKLSGSCVQKTTSGGASGRKTSDACLTEGRDARKTERLNPTSRARRSPNCSTKQRRKFHQVLSESGCSTMTR